MSKPPATDPSSSRTVPDGVLKATGVLFVKGTALALSCLVTALAVVLLPDGNDYAQATALKHDRLSTLEGPKIVFVGGSNLAFGLESQLVEAVLGRPVVNMGMNGYLGVRFMLEEVRPAVRSGDVIVLAFEYDSFYKSVEGTASDHLMIVKARPALARALTWRQRARVIGGIPYAAQQKLLRLTRDGVAALRTSALGFLGREDDLPLTADQQARNTIVKIETRAGFDQHGDINSHVGVPWPYAREDGIDLTQTPLDAEIVELLHTFAEDMRQRDVTVVLSYTPAIRYFYNQHQRAIDALHARFVERGQLPVPSAPRQFVFKDDLFFDTVYHLNERGRELRTRQVIDDLAGILERPTGSPRETVTR